MTGRERYAVIPDEAIRYALGRFGRPNIPIAPKVMERIESLPRTRELRAEPAMTPLAELRTRLGRDLSDEEFLLRATMAAPQVDAMRVAFEGPRTRSGPLYPGATTQRTFANIQPPAALAPSKW